MAEYKFRFRHLEGDIGPLQFAETTAVSAMKSSAFTSWPEEGPLASQVLQRNFALDTMCLSALNTRIINEISLPKPDSTQHLRIMYQGKILQDTQTILDLKQMPGELSPSNVVTLHLVIAAPGKLEGNRSGKNPESAEPGCCVVQ